MNNAQYKREVERVIRKSLYFIPVLGGEIDILEIKDRIEKLTKPKKQEIQEKSEKEESKPKTKTIQNKGNSRKVYPDSLVIDRDGSVYYEK